MPLPVVLPVLATGGIAAVIVTALRWFFMAHFAAAVIRLFAVLGIAWSTNELLIQPLIDQATTAWGALSGDLRLWLGAFGIDKVVSITISAYTIYGIKRLFLGKTA